MNLYFENCKIQHKENSYVKRLKRQAGSREPSEERRTMNVNSIQGC